MNILLLGGNGYIGSAYYAKSKFKLTSFDLCLFDKDLNYSGKINYNLLDISRYDVIICLAGHSSVPMCEYSPSRSWTNNVTYFRNLCERLSVNQKLIYASSASVYGTSIGVSSENSDINFNVLNHYDLQKITVDLIANKYISEGKNIIGLRFGTVNGYSPNTRSDLMINSMYKSAIETKKVYAKNLHIRRAILGINDLCNILDILVEKQVKCGQYNLASFNTTVGRVAKTVIDYTNAELIVQPNDKLAYDFELNTDKIVNATGYTFTDTIESLIEGLQNNFNSTNFDVRTNDRSVEIY